MQDIVFSEMNAVFQVTAHIKIQTRACKVPKRSRIGIGDGYPKARLLNDGSVVGKNIGREKQYQQAQKNRVTVYPPVVGQHDDGQKAIEENDVKDQYTELKRFSKDKEKRVVITAVGTGRALTLRPFILIGLP